MSESHEPGPSAAELKRLDTSDGNEGSLSARMEKRAKQHQAENSEKFDIPGWSGLLAVELRRLGYKTMRKIQKRNEKVRDEAIREIYNVADQVAIATEGLYEVVGTDPKTGDRIYRPLDDDWIRLAQRLEDCPDSPTTRQAILFLLGGDERVLYLAMEWGEWSKAGQEEEDEEVMRDFTTTG